MYHLQDREESLVLGHSMDEPIKCQQNSLSPDAVLYDDASFPNSVATNSMLNFFSNLEKPDDSLHTSV